MPSLSWDLFGMFYEKRLTTVGGCSTMNTLIKYDHDIGTIDVRELVQRSIRERKPFALTTSDPKLYRKKRIEVQLLYFIPLNVFELDDDRWLVSLEGFGAEKIDLRNPKPAMFDHLGLTPSVSRLICTTLRSMGDRENGKK